MKTSYQTLLKILLSGLILLSFNSFASDPSWMVKIEAKHGNEMITGTGYLVEIDGKLFVRTASHVTLGHEDVILTTGDGESLIVNSGKGLSHDSGDDHLISIQNKALRPLGVYDSRSKKFKIDEELYAKAKESSSIKAVEKGEDSAFYIVPSWTKGEARKYKEKAKTLMNQGLLDTASIDKLRVSASGSLGVSDTKIIPGESGSALIALDESGEPIIFGHAQSYQRYFEHSSFSTPRGGAEIVEALRSGINGHVNETRWHRKDGVFYRKNTEATEANFIDSKAGDGIIAGGGDGIIAGGGDGIIAGGGDGIIAGGGDGIIAGGGQAKTQTPGFGMLYKGETTYAFKITSIGKDGIVLPRVLYANWDNYEYIKKLKKKNDNMLITPITDKDSFINAIILRGSKADKIGTKKCSIDRDALDDGFLIVTLPGFQPLRVDISGAKALSAFSPILKLKRSFHDSNDWTIDLRGLFSADLSESEVYLDSSFVTLKHPSFHHVKLECALESFTDSIRGKGKISTILREVTKHFPNSAVSGGGVHSYAK